MSIILTATGHRPNKLGGYSKQVFQRLTDLANATLIKYKPAKVVSGMALGWDTAIAVAALEQKIPLVAAVPFKGQESKWCDQDKALYRYILEWAKHIEIVSEGGYAAYKMQVRNIWMVDTSNLVVALWDGSRGGTANCVGYARKNNKQIKNLWNSWEKYKRI